ncbi:MAG: AI-2E family transporter [Planctomycetota bacterium]
MPATVSPQQRTQTVCLLILAAVALGAALRWLSPVMVPFVLAFFLTVVLTPVVEVLGRRLHLPWPLALMGSAGIGVLILVLLADIVSESVAELQGNSGKYEQKIAEWREAFEKSEIAAWLHLDGLQGEGLGAEGSGDSRPETPPDGGTGEQDAVPRDAASQLIPPGAIRRIFSGVANALLSVLSQGVLVLIFMMFLMTPRASSKGTLGDVEQRIKGYVVTKVVVSTVTGIAVWLTLTLLGVEMAMVFGLFAFLLNFVPSVGSIISTVLPLPIVLVGDYSVAIQILAIALPGTIQFFIGNVIEPRMLGDSMDLHPVTILLSLIFWGMIWGVVGTLLATPITAVVRILLEKGEFTRPVAELMAGRSGAGGPTRGEPASVAPS